MISNQKSSKKYYLIAGTFLVIGAFVLGLYFGGKNSNTAIAAYLTNKETPEDLQAKGIDFAPFWKAWEIIEKKYPNGEVSDQDKVWGAISGLANSLGDPYTTFFPPEEAKMFRESIDGEFGGVGMEVGIRDKVLTVIAPLKDTPAYRAGIKSGDKILEIDEKPTADLSVDEAVSLIRGEPGTKVKLTIFRDGSEEPLKLEVTREIIKIPTLETEKKPGDIFVIKLYNFSNQSPNLFRGALRELIASNSKKLIIDLRGNPGGFLESSIDIASWFLPIGKPVVLEDFGDNQKQRVYRSKGYNLIDRKYKVVVLIDSGSASASEILAGALKDHKVATLVGEKTFGKGSVQELIDLTPETSLKVTVARWLTPNGLSISKQGLEPDVKVEITKADIEKKLDPQMDKAIEILNK